MTHEYKIIDPNAVESDEDKKTRLYANIFALEKHLVVLEAVESPTDEQLEEIDSLESELSSKITEYEALGGTFD